METVKILSVGIGEDIKIIHLHESELDSCIACEVGGNGICTETMITTRLLEHLSNSDDFLIYSLADTTDQKVNAAASSLVAETDECYGRCVVCKMTKSNGTYAITGLSDAEILAIISAMGILEVKMHGSDKESPETVG